MLCLVKHPSLAIKRSGESEEVPGECTKTPDSGGVCGHGERALGGEMPGGLERRQGEFRLRVQLVPAHGACPVVLTCRVGWQSSRPHAPSAWWQQRCCLLLPECGVPADAAAVTLPGRATTTSPPCGHPGRKGQRAGT